jgi:hypothetical protein
MDRFSLRLPLTGYRTDGLFLRHTDWTLRDLIS